MISRHEHPRIIILYIVFFPNCSARADLEASSHVSTGGVQKPFEFRRVQTGSVGASLKNHLDAGFGYGSVLFEGIPGFG